jgi:hypothetical protein
MNIDDKNVFNKKSVLNMKLTRRQLTHGTAVGALGALTGCTGQLPIGSNSDKLKKEAFKYEPKSPEENPLVEDGKLKYPQLIQCPTIESFDSDTLSVRMRIMPNPVDDYELEVYYTPLSEYGEGWTENYPGPHVTYDEDEERWNIEEGNIFPYYEVNGNGRKIASRTIRSKSAGLSSDEVDLQDLPDNKTDQYETLASHTLEAPPSEYIEGKKELLGENQTVDDIPEFTGKNDYWETGYTRERNTIFAQIKKNMDLPAIGDRWRFDGPASYASKSSDNVPIGSYLVGPANTSTQSIPNQDPYVLDFDIDAEKIPMNEPFVVSFGVSDPNSVASEDEALKSTIQCMRIGEDEFLYPKTSASAGKEFEQQTPYLKIQEWVEAENLGAPTRWDVEWMDTSDVYKTIKEEDTETTNTWRVTRATNLGRYSPKLDPHNEDYNVFDPSYMAYGTRPPHYLDTPYQNLWAIDYTVTESQIEELDSVNKSGNKVTRWTQNPAVQNHEVIQDVAEQLRNVCDRIDATENVERVRVVADFVQYFTHRADGTGAYATGQLPAGYTVRDNMNPLRTLYEAEGDCVSFTILANTILRTDYFDMNPTVGYVEDSGFLTADGREVGHMSTGIPYDELVIDSVNDTEYNLIESDKFASNTASEASFDDSMYVEMSSAYLLGSTSTLIADDIRSF